MKFRRAWPTSTRLLHEPSRLSATRQRVHNLARFLTLDPKTRRQILEIRAADGLDRRYYLAQKPTLNVLYRCLPTRHYVTFGRRTGRLPNADQSVPEGHVFPVTDKETKYTEFVTKTESRHRNSFCIVLHIHYRELFDEFSALLQNSGIDFDLYVTITDSESEVDFGEIAESIWGAFPAARIALVPNRGRDIFPFLHILNTGRLDTYSAICKLHTKKSPHRLDGDDWRVGLSSALLPAGETADMLEDFLADTSCQIMVADGGIAEGSVCGSAVARSVQRLLARNEGLVFNPGAPFPAGSMYWLKATIIQDIKQLQVPIDLFEPEADQLDGTAAHAFERLVGSIVEPSGFIKPRRMLNPTSSRETVAAVESGRSASR